MKNQNNQRIIQTPNGPLLIRKGLDEDGELAVKYSAVFDLNEVFVEPKVTMSFKNEVDRDKAYSVSDDDATGLFDSLYDMVKEHLK